MGQDARGLEGQETAEGALAQRTIQQQDAGRMGQLALLGQLGQVGHVQQCFIDIGQIG